MTEFTTGPSSTKDAIDDLGDVTDIGDDKSPAAIKVKLTLSYHLHNFDSAKYARQKFRWSTNS